MTAVPAIVVGAGPAGCAAAVQLARLGFRPRLLDRSGRAGGLVANAFLVENYPGLEAPLPGPAIAARLAEHVARFGIAVDHAEVRSVERTADGFAVRLADGELIARAVVLAPGTEPIPLGVPGEAEALGERLFPEPVDLLARLPVPGEVAIIGGGEAACDYALTMAARGARVRLLVRGDAPKANLRLRDRLYGEERVRIETGVRVVGLASASGGISLSVERSGPPGEGRIEADAALAAVGRRSRLGALPGGGSAAPGGPVLTAVPGLSICGDSRLGSLGQVGIAVGDGLQAAAATARFLEGEGAW